MSVEDEGSHPSAGARTSVLPTVAGHQLAMTHRDHVRRDLTSGSIPRTLYHLAWPQMIENVLNVVDHLADVFWAGRIGVTAIAGLGVGQSYVQLAMTGRMGFDTAMRAMVARAVGARDIRLANHVALQAFTLSSAFSLIMVLVGVFLTEPLMRLIGVSDEVVAAGADYMRIQFIGQGGVALRMMSGAALQASGDTFTPMKSTTVTRAIHITLSPCLVFGLAFFPQWGLAGAAAANALAQVFGAALNFYALFAGKSRLHLSVKGYQIDFPLLWRLARLGAPASITMAERVVAQIMLFGIVAPFGDNVVAAFSLTRRAEMLSHLGSAGLGQVSGTIVGQSLGAGKPKRARATVRWALLFTSVTFAAVSAAMFAFAEPIISIFSREPELVSIAAVWLRIQVVGYSFIGASMVFAQSFNTAGDTFVPMIVTLISIWGVQQPLALILPGLWGLGQYGVGWAINAAVIIRCLAYTPYFLWGPWMRKNVIARRQPT